MNVKKGEFVAIAAQAKLLKARAYRQGGKVCNAAIGKIELCHIALEGLAAEVYLDNIGVCLVVIYKAAGQSCFQFLDLALADLDAADGKHGKLAQVVQGTEIPDIVIVKVQGAQLFELCKRCYVAFPYCFIPL